MKKITSLLAMIMLAMVPFTLTSCDEDDDIIADVLWGTWEGNMYVTNEWNGHTYHSSRSIIQFDKDPYDYASGTGYWIDYYSNAPWDYFASHITWSVRDENILIYSREDDAYFYIHNYSLSENYFQGEIEDEFGGWQSFRLRKTSSPYWDGFDWGWGPYSNYVNKKNAKPAASFDSKSDNLPVRKIRKD